MAVRLTEDDKLMIKPEKKYLFHIFLLEIGIGVFCCWLYREKIPLDVLIPIYVVIEMLLLTDRCAALSKYVLDSRGITRIFWKYEKTFFWGEFETKRIEWVRGDSGRLAAIFYVNRLERPKWYQDEDWDYFSARISQKYFEFYLVASTRPHKSKWVNLFRNDQLSIEYDLFMQKMKDWNVDVPYIPWDEKIS